MWSAGGKRNNSTPAETKPPVTHSLVLDLYPDTEQILLFQMNLAKHNSIEFGEDK